MTRREYLKQITKLVQGLQAEHGAEMSEFKRGAMAQILALVEMIDDGGEAE